MAELTAKEYIEIKLKKFGLDFDANEIKTLFVESGIDATLSVENSEGLFSAQKALVSICSELLLMPDITEGGYSIKINREGIQMYLNQLSEKLGLSLIGVPKLKDNTNSW